MKEIYCSYCGAKLTSEDLSCLFCGTFSVIKQEAEKVKSEKEKVKEIARGIVDSKNSMEEKQKEWTAEELNLQKAETKKLKILADDVKADTKEIDDEIKEIKSFLEILTDSISAKKNYYYRLVKIARDSYPKYFIKSKKK